MAKRIRAWWLGFKDGWESPHDLGSGLTWENDQDLNEAYDTGVNWGQFLRSPLNHERS